MDDDIGETIQRMGKTIEFLQGKCRQAGKAIIDLNSQNETLKKEIDRLSEETQLKSYVQMTNKEHIKGDQAELIAQEFLLKVIRI